MIQRVGDDGVHDRIQIGDRDRGGAGLSFGLSTAFESPSQPRSSDTRTPMVTAGY
jgi:hypothetical protein